MTGQALSLPAFVELPTGKWIPLSEATRADIETNIQLERDRQDARRIRELKALLRFLARVGFFNGE